MPPQIILSPEAINYHLARCTADDWEAKDDHRDRRAIVGHLLASNACQAFIDQVACILTRLPSTDLAFDIVHGRFKTEPTNPEETPLSLEAKATNAWEAYHRASLAESVAVEHYGDASHRAIDAAEQSSECFRQAIAAGAARDKETLREPSLTEMLRAMREMGLTKTALEIVSIAYGRDPEASDGYLVGKAGAMEEYGFLWWLTELDSESLRRLSSHLEHNAK